MKSVGNTDIEEHLLISVRNYISVCKSRSDCFDCRHRVLHDGMTRIKTCVRMYMGFVFVVSLPIFDSHPCLGVCPVIFSSESLGLWLLCHFLTVYVVTLSVSQ